MSEGTLSCAACGVSFTAERKGRGRPSSVCSPECKKERARRRDAAAWVKRRDAMPRFVTKVCAVCGRSFTVTAAQSRRMMCSPECKKKRASERRSSHWPRAKCQRCGEVFQYKPSSTHKGKYCSRDCAIADQSRQVERTCEWCGAGFHVKKSVVGVSLADGRARGRFCSKSCVGKATQASLPPRPRKPKSVKYPSSRVYFRTCDVCGRLFASRSALTKRCSQQCKIDHAGVRIKDLYALATQYIDGHYIGGQWRAGLYAYLVERDGDKCGICGRKVNITLKSGTRGSRRGPSVDHIIPRSRGGSDDPSNWRLTHWGCNQSRGNRGGGEQLALVG